MTTIRELSYLEEISQGDQLVVYSQMAGDTRRVAISTFLDLLKEENVVENSDVIASDDFLIRVFDPNTETFVYKKLRDVRSSPEESIANQIERLTSNNSLIEVENHNEVNLLILPEESGYNVRISLPSAEEVKDSSTVIIMTSLFLSRIFFINNGETEIFGAPMTLGAYRTIRLRFIESENSWFSIG